MNTKILEGLPKNTHLSSTPTYRHASLSFEESLYGVLEEMALGEQVTSNKPREDKLMENQGGNQHVYALLGLSIPYFEVKEGQENHKIYWSYEKLSHLANALPSDPVYETLGSFGEPFSGDVYAKIYNILEGLHDGQKSEDSERLMSNKEDFNFELDYFSAKDPSNIYLKGSHFQEKMDKENRAWQPLPFEGQAREDIEKREVSKGTENREAWLHIEENISMSKFKDEDFHKVEVVEKVQRWSFEEVKRLSVRIEEGIVRVALLGDRLRISINLREDLYTHPTVFDVQKLLQSLNNLGLKVELLNLNGSNLYSSDQKYGARKGDKEKTYESSTFEFPKEAKRSFSLYL